MEQNQDRWETVQEIERGLDRQSYKLRGLAGLFFREDPEETINLEPEYVNGVYYLLDDLSDSVKALGDKASVFTKQLVRELEGEEKEDPETKEEE